MKISCVSQVRRLSGSPDTRVNGLTSRIFSAYLQALSQRLTDGPNVGNSAGYQRIRRRLISKLGQSAASYRERQNDFPISRGRFSPFVMSSAEANALNEEYCRLPQIERASIMCIVAQDLSMADAAEMKTRSEAFMAALHDFERDTADPLICARLRSAQDALRVSLEPLYRHLLEGMLREANGLRVLVTMRHDALLAADPSSKVLPCTVFGRDALHRLSDDLAVILRGQFNEGTWYVLQVDTHSPADIIYRLAEISSARSPQPVANVDDLFRTRILPENRRVYALFHPGFQEEPLVFLELALCSKPADKISDILASCPASVSSKSVPCDEATTAVFYSITSSQPGLAGLDLAGDLVKRVLRELLRDSSLNRLSNFVTMSPLKGFANWLRQAHPQWTEREFKQNRLMRSAAANYLLYEKKRGNALDPVANFHLRNGAHIEQVLWNADSSPRAICDGFGMMVSYKYVPARIEHNVLCYMHDGEAKCSMAVKELVESYRASLTDSPGTSY